MLCAMNRTAYAEKYAAPSFNSRLIIQLPGRKPKEKPILAFERRGEHTPTHRTAAAQLALLETAAA